ncbi:9404_t:CDS:2 [Dentiscutata erythropus]|uniref:9404_t:CDS:1 n=1 Tax=Dentiscutata erythropus TaxID=1348616 RepID=A0A9N9CE75_9GLOM|nr:9404_t:CDS:2 [Dentiscutata erythropus]
MPRFPWSPITASAGVLLSNDYQNEYYNNYSSTYDIALYIKAAVNLRIKGVTNLENRINEALNNDTLSIHELTKKFGEYYATKLYFGGRLTKTIRITKLEFSRQKSGTASFKTTIDSDVANMELNISHQNKHGENNKNRKEYDKIVSYGEDNWKVVDYDVEPIFNILKHTNIYKKVVKKILGKRILYKNINTIPFSPNEQYIHYNLNVCKDLEPILHNCQIFPSITRGKSPCTLKIFWMVIGYPIDFTYGSEIEFKYSGHEVVDKINSNNYSKPIKIQISEDFKKQNFCILVTCDEFFTQENKETLKTVMGVKLFMNNNNLVSRAFIFNPGAQTLNNMNCSTLKISYSIAEIDRSFSALEKKSSISIFNKQQALYKIPKRLYKHIEQMFITVYDQEEFVTITPKNIIFFSISDPVDKYLNILSFSLF